jgi:hypothetical protein
MAAYIRDWERLSDALKRVMATGIPEDEAKSAICNAIADQKIRVRIYFLVSPTTVEGLSRRQLSPREVRYVRGHEIPPRLKSDDFDWSQSRVRKPWPKVRSPAGSFLGHWLPIERSHHTPNDLSPQSLTSPRLQHPSYWHRVELFRPDVTKVLIAARAHKALSVGKRPRVKRRSSPSRQRAQRAIETLYPHGVPDQATEPNPKLFKRVGAMLKEQKLPDVSDDTILRAAGRRK